MGFRCGIVGLPNVGKSTLFNALTATNAALVANYPFATIEPNLGRVPVPDPRLVTLANLAKSAKITPTQLDFVDIAGLVKGASQGEGLGNKFLAHIREVDAIAHVLRCFEDGGIIHVSGKPDPDADADVVDTELMIADLDSLERRIDGMTKLARGGDRDAKARLAVAERILVALRAGTPARAVAIAEAEHGFLKELQLLTTRPVLFVLNVDETGLKGNDLVARAEELARKQGAQSVRICAAFEMELAEIADAEERQAFLSELGLAEPGLNRLIRSGYALLDLVTFFTVGPTETRAWTIKRGAAAVEAAGSIHTDFARGFIRAETTSYADYVACGGEQGAKDAGKYRLEGRDYVVKDGDVIYFRFNV
ncbi:MAG: redox-regulated ATPase YchF [Alphaproteobacteria bacterium]|nr:redox-regulated ATPase YchF [Alphaproteobacteria bacterium]